MSDAGEGEARRENGGDGIGEKWHGTAGTVPEAVLHHRDLGERPGRADQAQQCGRSVGRRRSGGDGS
ncbi:MAG: hypothetical protein ACRDT0_16515 [Pseudonocardiaceae bacterium]